MSEALIPNLEGADRLVGVVEIGDLLLPEFRSAVCDLTYMSGFPLPFDDPASGPIWLRGPVEAWLAEHRGAIVEALRGLRGVGQ